MHCPSIELLPPNWVPLERHLVASECAEFIWMYRHSELDHYKHIETRSYLRLDGEGKCFVPTEIGWKEVPFEDEWKRVSGRA